MLRPDPIQCIAVRLFKVVPLSRYVEGGPSMSALSKHLSSEFLLCSIARLL